MADGVNAIPRFLYKERKKSIWRAVVSFHVFSAIECNTGREQAVVDAMLWSSQSTCNGALGRIQSGMGI